MTMFSIFCKSPILYLASIPAILVSARRHANDPPSVEKHLYEILKLQMESYNI